MNPIAKARALLANREQDEAEAQRWRDAHADQILAAETDALIARMEATKVKDEIKTRDYHDGLLYRRNDNARVEQQQTFMSPENAARWAEWANSLIDVKIAEFNDTEIRKHVEDINEEFAASVKMSKSLSAEVRALDRKFWRRVGDDTQQRIVLYDPGQALEKEIEKVVTPLRAEIATLRKQVSELKKRS